MKPKLCVNCKHHRGGHDYFPEHLCYRKQVGISLVTGKMRYDPVPCDTERADKDCTDTGDYCGPEGKYFK